MPNIPNKILKVLLNIMISRDQHGDVLATRNLFLQTWDIFIGKEAAIKAFEDMWLEIKDIQDRKDEEKCPWIS